MINLFNKMFCNHDWKTHSKKLYEWNDGKSFDYSKTVEILICKKCGKIYKIKY